MLQRPVYMDNHATTRVDPRVLEAMRRVPRHLFVPEAFRSQAYAVDASLNIGEGQTISQARVVAAMTEARPPRSTMAAAARKSPAAAWLSAAAVRRSTAAARRGSGWRAHRIRTAVRR